MLLPYEFSSGILYQKLFNHLFGTKIDCMLEESDTFEIKLVNWRSINTHIFKEYLQGEFVLEDEDIKKLAKADRGGGNSDAIFNVLLETHRVWEETQKALQVKKERSFPKIGVYYSGMSFRLSESDESIFRRDSSNLSEKILTKEEQIQSLVAEIDEQTKDFDMNRLKI
jgi:hypothetical protein